MPEKYIATSSAFISLNLPGSPQFLMYLSYGGTPDKVKDALRKACSHRRTMVVARTAEYIFNVIGHLHRMLPQDAGGLWLSGKTRFHAMRATAAYHYYIGISGKNPIITWGSEQHEDLTEPFFRWLGSEWRRPISPRPARVGKARGGRPSGLRKSNPELFTNAKDGKALGLKDKRSKKRTIRVDFSLTPRPNPKFGETLRDLEDQAKEIANEE